MNFQLQEKLQEIQTIREANKALPEGDKNKVSERSLDLMEKMTRNFHGDFSKGRASLREALTTTDTVKLIPTILTGKLREAAEPEYLATRFFNVVNVDGGNSAVYVIPVVGEVVASEVSEGGRYREDYVDFTTIEESTLEIRVKKIGARVAITDEAIADSSWDILGINVRKMAKAMARYKEEWCMNAFTDGASMVFDNVVGQHQPEFLTTGRGEDGEYNGTLSVEDMLDMCLTLMSNGFNASDLIVHPLIWVVFARNAMIGNGLSFGALGGGAVSPWNTIQGTAGPFGLQNNGNGQKLIMRPEDVQYRLPVPLRINFSPFVHFDKQRREFDCYCLDSTEVGVIAQREGLSTETWDNPERDIKNLKCKERYGVGLLNNGRGITVAKAVKATTSHPVPPTVRVQTDK